MQTRYESAFIFESTTQMAEFCSNGNLPFIQGYYANCRVSEFNHNDVQDLKVHQKVISALWSRANLQIFVVELPLNLSAKPYQEFKLRLQQRGWNFHEKQMNSSDHSSDRIHSQFDLLIGLSANYFPQVPPRVWDYLTPTPAIPNGMSLNIVVGFNDAKYALENIGELFTVEPQPVESASRNSTVEYTIKLKEADLPPTFKTGFQVYHKDHPGPLPSETITGLFGSLFGISFPNLVYAADNEQPKESIRATALAEYTSLFGYDNNYSAYLNGQPDVVIAL
jgi:hypothetical protein